MTRKRKMQPREDYAQLVHYVATHNRVGFRFAANILTQFAKEVSRRLQEGYDIEIDTVCRIQIVSKSGNIFQNRVMGLEELLPAIDAETKGYGLLTRRIVFTYIQRIHALLERGQQVNIKGICYFRICEQDDYVQCDTRLSGALKKPHMCAFLVVTDTGELVLRAIPQDEIRLKVLLSDKLTLPSKSIQPQPLQLKQLDI